MILIAFVFMVLFTFLLVALLVATRVPSFVLCNVYVPNGCSGEDRLCYKMQFLEKMRSRCAEVLAAGKPVIVCGDLNICHQDIDYHTPQKPPKTSSFLPIERDWLNTMMEKHSFVDAFRSLHAENTRGFTWWDPKSSARESNTGWRLDYFLVTGELFRKVCGGFQRGRVHLFASSSFCVSLSS
jgi:exodeoxyribonuclease III